jgi:hypothetical protein
MLAVLQMFAASCALLPSPLSAPLLFLVALPKLKFLGSDNRLQKFIFEEIKEKRTSIVPLCSALASTYLQDERHGRYLVHVAAAFVQLELPALSQ